MTKVRILSDEETAIKPSFDQQGIGRCSEDECPQYDGKRCRAIGFRPDSICEPWVLELLGASRSTEG